MKARWFAIVGASISTVAVFLSIFYQGLRLAGESDARNYVVEQRTETLSGLIDEFASQVQENAEQLEILTSVPNNSEYAATEMLRELEERMDAMEANSLSLRQAFNPIKSRRSSHYSTACR